MPRGETAAASDAGGTTKGQKAALEHAEIFGPDHYYLELQNHGLPEQPKVNDQLVRLSEETGLPLVVTNDAHYLRQEDAKIQDVLMCIQMGKTVDDTNRLRFETQEFYLKSEAQMRELFPRIRRQSKIRRESLRAATSNLPSANITCRNSSFPRATIL